MLELQVSTDGAAIWRFFAKGESGGIPLMRAPAATAVGLQRSPLFSARAVRQQSCGIVCV